MWRYRDYVIRAFNEDKPFNQFIREQLAGDLLPKAAPSQIIATGYNRLLQTSHEGGVQPREYIAMYAADRVRNFSQVWMGATMGCAQCHDHKYDPVSQGDFYSLFAFFNQTPEPGTYRRNAKPSLKVPTRPDQRRLEEIARQLEQSDDNARKNLEEERRRLLDRSPETMIMEDSQKRDTFILERGQYDQQRQKVDPGVPGNLPSLPPGVETVSYTHLTLPTNREV